MRKVVLFIASSLDGYIARADGGIDWLFHDADYGYGKFYASVDTIIMGRKTYEQALAFGEWPFAGKRCYVCTRKRAMRADKRVCFAPDAVRLTRKLLRQKGKGIWLVGGGEIISALINKRLIDEVVLSIHPTVLGEGIPLFAGLEGETELKHRKTKSFLSGLVQLTYDVEKRGRTSR